MPFEIKFDNLPIGVSVTAAQAGDLVAVRSIEFVSEEDGDMLIDRLEGFGSDILAKISREPPVQPREIQHLLAVVRRDRTATVYINEPSEQSPARGLISES